MPEWFDYAIADEIHQLAGDTAQGNALGVLNSRARRFLGLTGTLLSGYVDDLFNTLFRTDAKRMTEDGYEWGSAGRERFTRDFGVIETIEWITIEDNACSKKTKKTVTITRKPGASPESMSQSAIARSLRPGWICWIFRRSCFMRRAILCTPYASPAGGRGVSDRDGQWR